MTSRHLSLPLALSILGCSTMDSTPIQGGAQQVTHGGPYAVVVNAGSLSPVVYEFAVREIGRSLPITEGSDAKGRVEVTFASTGESAFVGAATSIAVTNVNTAGWYSRNATYAHGTAVTTGSAVGSSGSLTWQNSTVLVVIRDAQGKRLWSADYAYKGGWELSGFYVNTPEEAARYCLKKINAQLSKDLTLP